MAIPSGSGTEVLKVSLVNQASGTAENVLINGVANHLYTILSVCMTNTNGSPSNINLFIKDDGGATDYYLLKSQAVDGYGTFVWSDKFVMEGTDEIVFQTDASEAFSIVTSYIDQDWS
jgi:hypothetical protein